MELDTQDVSGSTASAEPSADVSSDISSVASTANADSVTVQSDVPVSTQSSEGESATPANDDPLAGIPTNEELEANPNQPYAKALAQLRTAYESLKTESTPLKELEAYAPLKEYGDAATVKSRLELMQGLSVPVTENGQVVIDPQTGYPATTARPFLEGIGSQMVYKLIREAVSMPGVSGESIIREVLRNDLKLDPDRLADYQNLGSDFNTPTGVITAEELEPIPKYLHEAYKNLLPVVREYFQDMEPVDQQKALADSQRTLEADKWQRDETQRQEQHKAQQAQEYQRQHVEKVNTAFTQFYTDSFTSLAQNLVSQGIKYSSDEATNSILTNMQTSLMATAMNPLTRSLAESTFEAAGAKLDPQTYALVSQLEQKTDERLHYEATGDTFSAGNAKTEEGKLMQNILAKFAPILAKTAQVIMKTRNGDVPNASRPVANGNGAIPASNSPFQYLAGEKPGDLAPMTRRFEEIYKVKV